MYKRILITTDLTEESTAAFPVAGAFADAFGAEIILLTVIEDPTQAAIMPAMEVPILPPVGLQADLCARAEDDLRVLARRYFGDKPPRCCVQQGHAGISAEIVAFAEAQNIDLIVMTTHGRRGFTHMLIGSITEKVVQHAKVPVVAVPLRR